MSYRSINIPRNQLWRSIRWYSCLRGALNDQDQGIRGDELCVQDLSSRSLVVVSWAKADEKGRLTWSAPGIATAKSTKRIIYLISFIRDVDIVLTQRLDESFQCTMDKRSLIKRTVTAWRVKVRTYGRLYRKRMGFFVRKLSSVFPYFIFFVLEKTEKEGAVENLSCHRLT